jgi:hypothetical protein
MLGSKILGIAMHAGLDHIAVGEQVEGHRMNAELGAQRLPCVHRIADFEDDCAETGSLRMIRRIATACVSGEGHEHHGDRFGMRAHPATTHALTTADSRPHMTKENWAETAVVA